ncbi:MAG: MarC family protein [Lentisphaeria bacterium]|nr:MarC family protein [Lentisphaeria bacterium]
MLSIVQTGFSLYLKLFFLLTPFFVLGTFIALTNDVQPQLRRKLAGRITLGASAVTLTIFLAGTYIMKIFGITVNAFRAGSGALLLLTAVSLVLGKAPDKKTDKKADELLDLAIVPLATPITAGPATLGALMVMGTTTHDMQGKLITSVAIIMACCSIGFMLMVSDKINKALGHANITILSKITGLILSAIALQMIVVGAKGLWLME